MGVLQLVIELLGLGKCIFFRIIRIAAVYDRSFHISVERVPVQQHGEFMVDAALLECVNYV